MERKPAIERNAEWRLTAQRVLQIESAAVNAMAGSLDDSFVAAVETIVQTSGKLICCGVGKSGHIAGKVAATFSSTGTPAFFMHASEAGHGDLGMIGDHDTLLLFSYSGESKELLEIIPALKRLQIKLIAVVGVRDSTLAQAADICLLSAVEKEACPHNLAPTASTTAALALADALAMTVLTARGFLPDDFARTHPSGKLGRRLLLRVSDVMRRGQNIPLVQDTVPFSDALLEMTAKQMGMTLVCDKEKTLCGIITDGDLRRALDKFDNLQQQTVGDLIQGPPQSVSPETLAADALRLMKEKHINHLAVTDASGLAGALSFHDLLMHRIL